MGVETEMGEETMTVTGDVTETTTAMEVGVVIMVVGVGVPEDLEGIVSSVVSLGISLGNVPLETGQEVEVADMVEEMIGMVVVVVIMVVEAVVVAMDPIDMVDGIEIMVVVAVDLGMIGTVATVLVHMNAHLVVTVRRLAWTRSLPPSVVHHLSSSSYLPHGRFIMNIVGCYVLLFELKFAELCLLNYIIVILF